MAKESTPTFLQFTLPDGKRWAVDDSLIYAVWDQGDGKCGVEIGGHIIVDVLCSYDTVLTSMDHTDLTAVPPKLELVE